MLIPPIALDNNNNIYQYTVSHSKKELTKMKRAYYSNSIKKFLEDTQTSILGELILNHTNRTLEDLQKNAWIKQIQILKDQLVGINGQIYFEFTIPRMGKRVDNIIIIDNVAFVIEFKVGDKRYEKYAIEQVIDYTIDLSNFHEGSHKIKLIPVLVSTNANTVITPQIEVISFSTAAKANRNNLKEILNTFLNTTKSPINVEYWENSIYKPTPTIVEAAQALYNGHIDKEYLKNTYRVLLTRARQGMVIFIPEGSEIDHTRPSLFYDKTYEYLKELGIIELK